MIIPVCIICSIFALIGAWVLKVTQEDIQTANASKLWPSAQGKIIDVDLHQQLTKNTDSRSRYVYKIRIKYEYVIAGTKYISNKLNLGQVSTSNKRKVEAKALELMSKDQVDVFYDPKNPEIAILETGMSSGIKFTIFCGLTFLLFGIIPPLSILLYKANMLFNTH
jgi:hypothetical protein